MPAAIVGVHEYKPQRFHLPRMTTGLEDAADLTFRALDDAGLTLADVNGVSVSGLFETAMFQPVTLTEYLGLSVDFADAIDFGGATPAAMVGRAAMAIEAGMCDVVVCVVPGVYPPTSDDGIPWTYLGASSYNPGSPQAEFEIPLAHLGQNAPYAFIARRYGAVYGYDERAMAKLAASSRYNAALNPDAIFYDQPVTIEDVLESRIIASPLHLLEIVRPVTGGCAVIVASEEVARRCRHRPAYVAGYGEGIAHKSPQFAIDMLEPPLTRAADRAFARAGVKHSDIDAAQVYDCYTIAVLMALESAGFCKRGEGMRFVNEHDLRFSGDFPLNTNGGQLGFGQAGGAGGMTHVIEGAKQLMGRGDARQVKKCDTVFVSGNGGIMSEQTALILRGD